MRVVRRLVVFGLGPMILGILLAMSACSAKVGAKEPAVLAVLQTVKDDDGVRVGWVLLGRGGECFFANESGAVIPINCGVQ